MTTSQYLAESEVRMAGRGESNTHLTEAALELGFVFLF